MATVFSITAKTDMATLNNGLRVTSESEGRLHGERGTIKKDTERPKVQEKKKPKMSMGTNINR